MLARTLLLVTLLLSPAAALAAAAYNDHVAAKPVLTTTQKLVVMWQVETAAVQCIGRVVMADPRYDAQNVSSLGDLIIDSVRSVCLPYEHFVMDTYDDFFGKGGEDYVMGPHLDFLGPAVDKWIKENRR